MSPSSLLQNLVGPHQLTEGNVVKRLQKVIDLYGAAAFVSSNVKGIERGG